MRQMIKDFLSIAASDLEIRDPVYEFGALQVKGQEGFADLRPLFPGHEYVGADMREGAGVDKILDLHAIDLPSESVGTILCMDVLEHVEYPRKAVEEIHRVLVPDGMVIMSSVMCFPIHDFPYDYWRFTPDGFRSLLKPFRGCFIGYAGREDLPHTVLGIGFKGQRPPLSDLTAHVNAWKAKQDREGAQNRFIYALKLITPPILRPVLRSIYRVISR